jgi:serine/threonine protein kinase
VSSPSKVYAVKIYDPEDNVNARGDFDNDVACFGAIESCRYPKDGRSLIVQKVGQFPMNSDECHFLVMEKIRDKNSEADLMMELAMVGGFDEDVAKDVFAQLAYALGCVHEQHYIHRDLKADNILIESSYWQDGKKYYNIKLTDFGIARRVHPKLEVARSHLGTINMKPPEIEEHAGLYNGKAVDMWGLGVILYTMVLGEGFPGPKITVRSGGLRIPRNSNWFKKSLSSEVKNLIENLLRWEADPAGFCPRISLQACRKHPWLVQEPSDETQTASQLRRSTSHSWTSSRPVFFCQRLRVTEDECDGCFLHLPDSYEFLGHGIHDNEFVKSKCLGVATRCQRQVLSVVSMGVHVQRTQAKLILRHGDMVYYGVANTLSRARPAQKEFHTEFEGRLCRNAGVAFGLMECVEFHVRRHMDKCVIGGPEHRGNDQSLGWIRFRNNFGGLSIAILLKKDGTERFYPLATEVLHEGDTLLIPRRFMEDDYSCSPSHPNWKEPENVSSKEREDEDVFEETISKHALNFENKEHFSDIVEKKGARGAIDES